jgi:hypothetical protein
MPTGMQKQGTHIPPTSRYLGRHNYWTLACFQVKSNYVQSLLSSLVVKENFGWKLNAMDSGFFEEVAKRRPVAPKSNILELRLAF